jgi:hypothetical protein
MTRIDHILYTCLSSTMSNDMLNTLPPFFTELVSRTYEDEREMQEILNFMVSRARRRVRQLKMSVQTTYHDWGDWLHIMKLELVSTLSLPSDTLTRRINRKSRQSSSGGPVSTIGALNFLHSLERC